LKPFGIGILLDNSRFARLADDLAHEEWRFHICPKRHARGASVVDIVGVSFGLP